MAGYNQTAHSTAGTSNVASTAVERVIGRMDFNGNIDTTTALIDLVSAGSVRSAYSVDGTNFWAQMKYAELHYRLRAMRVAEQETLKAIELAQNHWQLGVARRQMQEIRRFTCEGARDVTSTKSLVPPTIALSLILLVTFVVMLWK